MQAVNEHFFRPAVLWLMAAVFGGMALLALSAAPAHAAFRCGFTCATAAGVTDTGFDYPGATCSGTSDVATCRTDCNSYCATRHDADGRPDTCDIASAHCVELGAGSSCAARYINPNSGETGPPTAEEAAAIQSRTTELRALSTHNDDFANWNCVRLCPAPNATQLAACKTGAPGCTEAGTACCPPGISGVPVSQQCVRPVSGAGGATSGTRSVLSGAINLPGCISDGNCQLDDIVTTGVSFANYLFGISGSLFLLIFVYGGFLYLIAGGDSGKVTKAKKMLVDATIGMVVIFGAASLVRYVVSTFVTNTNTPAGQRVTCGTTPASQGYTCQSRPDTALRQGCLTGLCQGQSVDFVCCPVTPGGTP